MKTLDGIQEEVKNILIKWEWTETNVMQLFNNPAVLTLVEEVAHRFAKEVAKEALKNASENVRLTISEYCTRKDGSIGWNEVTLKENLYIINDGCNIVANKKSILNESNIPNI